MTEYEKLLAEAERGVQPRSYLNDPVNRPKHYTNHPSGIECIQITEHMGFNLGNAVKYLFRNELKHSDPVLDLEKALWYCNRHVENVSKGLALRSVGLRKSQECENQEGAQIGNDKKWIHDVYDFVSETVVLCAQDGFNDFCRRSGNGLHGVSLERNKIGQQAGESCLGTSCEKHDEEMGSQDFFPRKEESVCKAYRRKDSGNQNSSFAGVVPIWIIEAICSIQNNDLQDFVQSRLGLSKLVLLGDNTDAEKAIFYLFKSIDSNKEIEDLKKAVWYINREIEKRCKKTPHNESSKTGPA